MLQFIAQENDKYSIAEQAQMAIEGGCKWIILRLPEADDAEIREICTEVIPLCKETETILTIENHAEMAKELSIHGVHLRQAKMSPAAVRELLGPEAIIGVEVGMASAALPLATQDMDYVSFPADMPMERLSENVEALRGAEFMLAIVAEGDYSAEEIPEIIGMGINGVAESKRIVDAHDPVAETEKLLNALNSAIGR